MIPAPVLIHVGNNHFINAARVITVASPDAATVRRALQKAKAEGLLLDYTASLKTKGAVLMDSGIMIRIPLRPRDVAFQLSQLDTPDESR